ncbi:hypothetical protein [Ottowia caeni]|uniref:hypothetical protein n=1 Tax=Ottowia caeni TaxID=2870339 RepID=UPI001E388F0C|nr:hypothetical protein [Ottowia caeni]
MGVILLEALGAGLLFVLIVWWTMFSGRKKGELPGHHDQAEAAREVSHASESQSDPEDSASKK